MGRNVRTMGISDSGSRRHTPSSPRGSATVMVKEASSSPDSVMLLVIDDLPSAVEQAWALAPDLAGEHLELIRGHSQERYDNLLRELGAGTDREAAERRECLAFWEENAELMTPWRLRLYREVRQSLRVPRST